MSIKLSVIVPVYGVEKYIERCAISLFEQTLEDVEYIFVNDKTRDSSIEVLNSVIRRYSNLANKIKVINHDKNLGSAASRATGLKYAQGKYIINCDSDDWVDKELYERMYLLAEKEDADIVCCNFKFIYNNSEKKVNFNNNTSDFLNLHSLNFDLLYSSLCNKIVNRKLYLDNRIYFYQDINMWEDLGIMTRLRYYCNSVAFLQDKLYYNYNKQNQSSIVSVPKESNIQQQIACARQLEKFFLDKSGDYSLVISFLKFMAKSDYLYNNKIRNIDKWCNIFEETHEDIFKYKTLPSNMKWLAWLAANNQILLLKILISIKNRLIEFKR
ncbi:glycosyltransferase [Moraxella osloensis]|uniref:Glycosyltransferase n=1 Tax=Faucicola osloensis TaxID=34062 RepID=A0A6P1KD69_FAUOS|nr:glycosyltransferase family 2 protein [Moraxella osloensis]QHG09536.1 glycosyltransferase [Moraxella osloensis]